MTVPLPLPGDTDWIDWAQYVHGASQVVTEGRLSEDNLPAASVAAIEDAATVAPTGAWDFAQAPTVGGVPVGSGGPAAALSPVQLKRATAGGSWTDAAGTVYNNAARTALRPHPIYWLAAAGAEPTWSANTYDANTTYGDIVNVTA